MSTIAEAARELGKDGPELALDCGACGERGRYRAGRVLIDPERLRGDPDGSVAFTGVFGCRRCGAEGPWKLPTMTRIALLGKLIAKRDDVIAGKLVLFDGTTVRTGAEAVRHLRALLEKDPESAFLWDRLGNAYQTGGVLDEAVRAWERAIAIDEDALESHYSLGLLGAEVGLFGEALPHLHAVLALARKKRSSIPKEKLRHLVKDALEALLKIRTESGDEVDVFPPPEPSTQAEQKEVTVYLTSFDLSREAEWDRFADVTIGLDPASSPRRQERARRGRKRPW